MTEQEKAVEEMAREICGMGCPCICCCFNGHCITKLDTKILYERGYRKTSEEYHTETLNNAIDAAFRGAVLRFAEKLKKCTYCDNDFMDGKWHRYVFIEDIDRIVREFLEYDK